MEDLQLHKNKSVTTQNQTCPDNMISWNHLCYLFLYFDGSKMVENDMHKMCSAETSQPTVPRTETFEFLFAAVRDVLPPLLFASTKHKLLLVTFKYIWHTIEREESDVGVSNSSGLYTCKKAVSDVKLEMTLLVKCDSGQFVSSHYFSQRECGPLGSKPLNCTNGLCCSNMKIFTKTHSSKHDTKKCTCPPLFYVSNQKTCVSYVKQDNVKSVAKQTIFYCNDSKSIDMRLVNDLVPDCSTASDEPLLVHMLTIHCSLPSQIPCKYGHSLCYNLSDICIYRLNEFGYLIPCRTGNHLEECNAFQCNKEFKCVGYFCIPWGYVCDAKWDCPHGTDENYVMNCSKGKICSHMFHCHESQLCIHVEDLCNGILDCPKGDDEMLCQLKSVSCPQSCDCFHFGITCSHVTLNKDELKYLPHIAYFVTFTNINMEYFPTSGTVVLNVSHNNIENICDILSAFSSLYVFDVSFNNVISLTRHCVSNSSKLFKIQMHHNSISQSRSKAFAELKSVLIIDLSTNNLHTLPGLMFFRISHWSTLILYKNPLLHISVIIADLFPNLLIGSTSKLCCVLPRSSKCLSSQPGSVSCSSLLPTVFLSIVVGSVAGIVVVFTFLSLVINNWVTLTENRKVSKYITAINVTDLCCAIYLIIILNASIYYKTTFPIQHLDWARSVVCTTSYSLITFFHLSSPINLSLLAVSRFGVAKAPFSSKFKSNKFVNKLLLTSTICILCIVAPFDVWTVKKFRLNDLCFPLMLPNAGIPSTVSTFVLSTTQVCSFVSIVTVYTWLIKLISSQSFNINYNCQRVSLVKTQVTFLIISNFVSWILFNTLFLFAVLFHVNSKSLILWIITLLMPFNSVVNPVILNLPFLKKFGTQQKSNLKRLKSWTLSAN